MASRAHPARSRSAKTTGFLSSAGSLGVETNQSARRTWLRRGRCGGTDDRAGVNVWAMAVDGEGIDTPNVSSVCAEITRMSIYDLWYKDAVIYCLAVEKYQDANGDGIG